jgi:cellulose synthase/poly-beta-1,6-N-acetylglucosamine synthase-like glycosyltransferase
VPSLTLSQTYADAPTARGPEYAGGESRTAWGTEGSSPDLNDRVHIAVVIPVAHWQPRLLRCLAACAELTYEPRTIIVVSDAPIALPLDPHFINVVTRASSVTSPGAKRDLARTAFPDADVYAYLDDDAFPPAHWLEDAAQALHEQPAAAGVAGPGIMPDDQTFW